MFWARLQVPTSDALSFRQKNIRCAVKNSIAQRWAANWADGPNLTCPVQH